MADVLTMHRPFLFDMRGARYLFIIAASLMAATSCTKESGAGLDLQDDLLNASFTDTLTVNLSTILDNRKIITEGSNLTLIGSANDAIIGQTNAHAYIELTESSDPASEALICDSVVLRLSYFQSNGDAVVYGDTNTATQLGLYNLSENFEADSSYSSIHTIADEGTDYLDTAVLFTPTSDLLKLNVSTTLGQAMLDANDAGTFEDNFHGIVLKGEGGNGAIVAIDLIDSDSEIEIYYHSSTDTSSMRVNMVNTTHFHSFTYDRTGTEFAALNAVGTEVSSENSSNIAIVQSGTGIAVKIDIPHLQTFLSEIDPATINKAVLKLHIDNSTTGAVNTKTPAEVILVRTENNVLLRDESDAIDAVLNDSTLIGIGGSNFNYDESGLDYELTIGLHIQDLLSGDMYYPLTVYSNEVSTASKAVILDRFSGNADFWPTLEIYYTEK